MKYERPTKARTSRASREQRSESDSGLAAGLQAREARGLVGPGTTESEAPVQASGNPDRGRTVHQTAQAGLQGGAGAIPHAETIQKSFGQHDVSSIRAHVGGLASDACQSMGAEAYATGNSVAFASSPNVHCAAHEAAHIVQQRAGVSLQGGVGKAGDRYEQHADRVADTVASGGSAESLLDHMVGGSSGAGRPSVQHTGWVDKPVQMNIGFAGQKQREGDLKDDLDTGEGDRNVRTMLGDNINREFADRAEMLNYIGGNTTNIGYIAKHPNKPWVRLPDVLTVFGEDHSVLTLLDVVEATGATRWKYEANPNPSEYLEEKKDDMKDDPVDDAHQLESVLPKLAIGLRIASKSLVVLAAQVKQARTSPWANRQVNNDDGDQKENDVGYSQEAKGGEYARRALNAMATAPDKFQKLKVFYKTHQRRIDKVRGELNQGVPLGESHLLKYYVKEPNKFGPDHIEALAKLYEAEAVMEAAKAGVAPLKKDDGYEQIACGNDSKLMEELRDAWMMKGILASQNDGTLQVGIGNNHLTNLKAMLDTANIENAKLGDFVQAERLKYRYLL